MVLFVRALRILAVATVLSLAFRVSDWAGKVRGNEPVTGLSAAIGALALLFMLRAAATEVSRGPEANIQKDFLWGVGLGCAVTVAIRFFA